MDQLSAGLNDRVAYVNDEYVSAKDARISIFDRGFLFADAVYEVTAVIGGKLIDFDAHMQRLERSLREIQIPNFWRIEYLRQIHERLIILNDVQEGLIYLQISRGEADRDFAYPPTQTRPTLVLFTQQKSILNASLSAKGLSVIAVEDLRWGRRDIKTVQLLYPSMAKMLARQRGADDAWLCDGDYVTEGTAQNVYIVKNKTLVTRSLSKSILGGITRAAVLKCATGFNIEIAERAFSLAEAKSADEAFSTSATTLVMPVVEIDGCTIGDGLPGPITKNLLTQYIKELVDSRSPQE
ncbi:D-amino-acid transaminase [Aquamicrobium terrae]|uniref:Probable branched-chain-amino-acid aminotransferase n=1 Tax=Aquamicrobium terrae TaxID=1324945 RepID=A0ABV2N0D4_9HYPH